MSQKNLILNIKILKLILIQYLHNKLMVFLKDLIIILIKQSYMYLYIIKVMMSIKMLINYKLIVISKNNGNYIKNLNLTNMYLKKRLKKRKVKDQLLEFFLFLFLLLFFQLRYFFQDFLLQLLVFIIAFNLQQKKLLKICEKKIKIQKLIKKNMKMI